MIETPSNKTHNSSPIKTVLGMTVLTLLILVSIAATANSVAAAEAKFKDYVPNYKCADILVQNNVGTDIVVSWAPVGSKKAIFQVNIPKGKTHAVSAPKGSYNQYVRTGGHWYTVTKGSVFVKCGYKYTYKLAMIKYNGTGFKYIPDSKAPKI